MKLPNKANFLKPVSRELLSQWKNLRLSEQELPRRYIQAYVVTVGSCLYTNTMNPVISPIPEQWKAFQPSDWLTTSYSTLVELEKSKPQCPPGWDELSTACYKVYSGIRGMSPWADASKVCQASRASLVSITSPDERKEVLSLMQRYSEGMYGYWIGLKRSFSNTFS